MVGFSRRTSMSFDFMVFSVMIFAVISIISLGFWIQVYQEELESKHEQLSIESSRISSQISDSISYIGQYAAFVGEKIAQHDNPDDLQYIANLISGRYITQPQTKNFYYTTTFDWVTPDGMLRASNDIGVLQEPYDMTDRDYLKAAAAKPWQLQLSKPRIGGISGKWILPAGMSITDEKGKFIGSVTLGFALGGLEKKLSEARMAKDLHYMVLTNDFQPVLNSDKANSEGPDTTLALKEDAQTMLRRTPAGYLEKPIQLNDIEYRYTENVTGYPFLILVGYADDMPWVLFTQTVISRGLGLLAIVMCAITALYMLRRRLVKPIIELTRKADLIRQGNDFFTTPTAIHEIAVLDNQLSKISEYIKNEHRITQELSQKTLELEEANTEAYQARDEALRANHAKSEFLANMSHELRTPMNVIVGLSTMMRIRPELAQEDKYLSTLQASANQLLQLINDLLDLSKLDSGAIKLESIPFSLKTVINDVLQLHCISAQEKGIILDGEHADIADNMQFVGDPHRLKQVLVNLVSNAVKFTHEGNVTISWEYMPASQDAQCNLKIYVTDTGIGIPKEHQQHIFNKFTQADTSTTRKYGGTGLGLTISRNLVELMGGSLSVESESGKGSRFIISLSLTMVQNIPSILSKEFA